MTKAFETRVTRQIPIGWRTWPIGIGRIKLGPPRGPMTDCAPHERGLTPERASVDFRIPL